MVAVVIVVDDDGDDDDVGMIVVTFDIKDLSFFDENTTKVTTIMSSKEIGDNKTEKDRFDFVRNNSCSNFFVLVLIRRVRLAIVVFGSSV